MSEYENKSEHVQAYAYAYNFSPFDVVSGQPRQVAEHDGIVKLLLVLIVRRVINLLESLVEPVVVVLQQLHEDVEGIVTFSQQGFQKNISLFLL